MKGLVLSSGGVDSTTCLALAIEELGKENVVTVTINYGQRHDREIESARKIAKYYDVEHFEYDLSNLFKFSNCSLIKTGREVEESSYSEQLQKESKISSYVPFRNGLMLSICAVLAQSLWEKEHCKIYLGNHASDFAYADCTKEFTDKMQEAISQGTYGFVEFTSSLLNMTKSDVVNTGIKLKVPYELTWSCYKGLEKPCCKCASCIDRIKAFRDNGVEDPLLYN